MNFLKKNIRTIIGFIVGVIFASGITVYAYSYFAKDISYTREGTEIKNVADALNDLYKKANSKSFEFGEPEFETYRGDRKSVTLTKKVNRGKYLVVVSKALGSVQSKSYNDEIDEDTSIELICDKECNIRKVSNKYIYNTSSGKVANNTVYAYYNLSLGLYEVLVEEDNTTITFNHTNSEYNTYAQGCILETIKLN